MNAKKIIILAGLLLIIGIVGYTVTKKQTPTPQELIDLGLPTSVPGAKIDIPTGDKLNLDGNQVSNVYKSAKTINENGDVIFAESDKYQEIYHPQRNNFFLISIIGSPFEEARKEAETKFLESLEISAEEACKLNVAITTPRFANPNEAGTTYRLSFCE